MLYNEKQAMREGWLLLSRDDGFYEVQRFDNGPSPFKTDDDALAWVKRQRSLMHREAAALNGQRWR